MTAPYIPPSSGGKGKDLVRALLKSPVADSMWQASSKRGGPATRPFTVQSGLIGDADGAYNPLYDLVIVNPRAAQDGNESLRDVLAHEAGHRAHRNNNYGGNAPFRLPDSATASDRASVDAYYQESPEEGYAQAFRNAYNALTYSAQTLPKRPDVSRQEALRQLANVESKTPGTGEILRDLLHKNPLFKNHPLQRFIPAK